MYLWSISLCVAIPVVIICAIAAILYILAIILPFTHDFCPYETALSKLLKPWAQAWFRAWFRPGSHLDLADQSLEEVPMDLVTSRALSWLISSCENPKAVDVALQSIAGADHSLPCGPLWECNATMLIAPRIQECFGTHQLSMDRDLNRLGELHPEQYSSVLVYARSLNFLVAHLETPTELSSESSGTLSAAIKPLNSLYRT